MSGFEESGLPGKNAIREGFQSCPDVETFITSFQQDNCVLLPSLHPALPLLELQDVRRINFHQSIMVDLSDRLSKRIRDESDEKRLSELLDHIFQFIHVTSLRPIIMATMKKLQEIKTEYIELIATNQTIYMDSPIEVKRYVWMRKHALFGDAVGPILNKYVDEKRSLLYTTENIKVKHFFSIPPRQRRQKQVIKHLVDMIGNSVELYNLVLQFLRTLFLRTKEEHYCSLRDELLMAFHDADIKEIRQVDPCHKFCWCLDACIRDRSIDSKRLKELQLFMDGIKKGQEEVMGDIAMILCDPYATYTIATSILHQLTKMISMEILPRSSSELMFLVRLLSLSVTAWNIIKTQSFTESPVNIHVITKFLPMLMSLMLENSMGVINGDTILPESMIEFCKHDPVALTILCFYINYLLQVNKRTILDILLPNFANALQTQPINSALLNLMVHSMLKHVDKFSEPSHCVLLCDKFLFIWLQYEEVLHHILRILWNIHEKVDSQQMVQLLTATQPSSQHSETVHDLHSKLVDLIASSKINSHSSSVDQIDSLSPKLKIQQKNTAQAMTAN